MTVSNHERHSLQGDLGRLGAKKGNQMLKRMWSVEEKGPTGVSSRTDGRLASDSSNMVRIQKRHNLRADAKEYIFSDIRNCQLVPSTLLSLNNC